MPPPQLEIIRNGYLECDKGMVTIGGDMGKKIRLPVFCFLVRHEKGNVLIDTGMSPDFKETWGKRLKFYTPILETDLVEHLGDLPIKYVINTHLHIDHSGNNHAFKGAPIIIQKKEYESAMSPKIYQKFAYPDYFEKALKYEIIEGSLDIFGDGVIKIVPTPGHTPGHQSVFLNSHSKIFIAGDCCYSSENLKHNCLPGILWSPDKMMECYEMIRSMKGTKIIFGHEEPSEELNSPSRA